MDGAQAKAEVNSSDMKRFLSIISEGKGPLNRPTAAESLTMQHYTAPKKTITVPVLNVAEDATPSMIGKYFKTVEQELKEAAARPNERARQLAERVVERIAPNEPIQEQYSYKDIAEMARSGLDDNEIASKLGFDLSEGLKDPKDNPCWKGYKPVGTKKKAGKTVPNCVPTSEAVNAAQQAAIAIAKKKKAGKK